MLGFRPWQHFNWKPFLSNPENTDPVRFWAIKTPQQSPLCIPAIRIVNLSVVSSESERAHQILKRNRT